jgi:RNA polymerase-interacting CarD/CdnL/TRCF family regulator
VQSIRKRSFSGSKGLKFAKIFFPREDLVMMVRERDLAGTIRKPIEKSEARKVLAHIGEWNESVSDEWKVRASAQQLKLDGGDAFALAEVYKTLSLRHNADCLSAADRRQLSQSKQCLSEQLAVALDRPMGKVSQRMEQAALN